MDISTLHLDGWQLIDTQFADGSKVVEFGLIISGDVVARTELARFSPDVPQPAYESYCKLGAAISRFVNEGGHLDAARDMLIKLSEQDLQLSASMELVSLSYTETHERIYSHPDGNYVRVVEDEFSEVLTPQELLALSREVEDSDLLEYKEICDGEEEGGQEEAREEGGQEGSEEVDQEVDEEEGSQEGRP